MLAPLVPAALPARVVALVHGKTCDSATGDQFASQLSDVESHFERPTPDRAVWNAALLQRVLNQNGPGGSLLAAPTGVQQNWTPLPPSEAPVIPSAATSMLAALSAKPQALLSTPVVTARNSAPIKAAPGKGKKSAPAGQAGRTIPSEVGMPVSTLPNPLTQKSAFGFLLSLPRQSDTPASGSLTELPGIATVFSPLETGPRPSVSDGLESKPDDGSKTEVTLDALAYASAAGSTQLPGTSRNDELAMQGTPKPEIPVADAGKFSEAAETAFAVRIQEDASANSAQVNAPQEDAVQAAVRIGDNERRLETSSQASADAELDGNSPVEGMLDVPTYHSSANAQFQRIPRSGELVGAYTARPEGGRAESGESNHATETASGADQPQSSAAQPAPGTPPRESRPDKPEPIAQTPGAKTVSGADERKPTLPGMETAQNPQAIAESYGSRDDLKGQSSKAEIAHATAQVETPAAEAEPTKLTAPLKDVSFQVAQANEKIEVRIVQQAGEVRVAVRAEDTDLVHGLRQNLSELSGKLQQGGYNAETWRPVGSTDAIGAGNDPRKGSGDGGNGQPQSQSGGSQQDRGQQNQNRFNRPRWVEEMESTLNTGEESTGVTYGFGS